MGHYRGNRSPGLCDGVACIFSLGAPGADIRSMGIFLCKDSQRTKRCDRPGRLQVLR